MGYAADIFDTDLSARAKYVYCLLAKFTNNEGCCWPSLQTLAKKGSIAKTTLYKPMEELEASKWIIVERRKSQYGDNDVNKYFLPRLIDEGVGLNSTNGRFEINPGVGLNSTCNLSNRTIPSNYNSFVPEKSVTKKKREFIFSQEHAQLAEYLKGKILEHKPNFKCPNNLDQWANTIRLMIKQDNRAFDEITAVIDWCQKDSFWQSNILSADTLRGKFDQLQAQMTRTGTKQKSNFNPHEWGYTDV